MCASVGLCLYELVLIYASVYICICVVVVWSVHRGQCEDKPGVIELLALHLCLLQGDGPREVHHALERRYDYTHNIPVI